ncbi:MAG: diguanylate cyclase, partial [Pseudomonas graminis]
MKVRISFQARIAGVLIMLLLIVVFAVFIAVRAATQDAVRKQAQAQLEVGTRVFEGLLEMRGKRLRDAVQLLSTDFGFRDAVASADSATIRSVLLNHGARINANDMFLLGMDGTVMASTVAQIPEGSPFPYTQALRELKGKNQSMLIVPLQGQPHLLVESTVLAPLPIARVVMGFSMDGDLAQELRSLSGLQVSFLSIVQKQPGQMISTQPAPLFDSLRGVMMNPLSDEMQMTEHQNQSFLSKTLRLGSNSDSEVVALLQSPLDQAMQAFAPLDKTLFWITVVALACSLVGALLLARNLSRPVSALAQAARRIGEGDYATPVVLDRRDELGLLASAINSMQSGIAERELQLAHNALHDPLTGLPNRALVMERLGSAVIAQRPVALLYLGIDNFRAISTNVGLEGVEQLLRIISEQLQEPLRPGDTVARLSDNEFLLLVHNAETD